jgi:serine/threonine-protein kinase
MRPANPDATEPMEALDAESSLGDPSKPSGPTQPTVPAVPSAPASHPSTGTPSTPGTPTSPLDVMRRQEIERARVFVRLAIALAAFVLILALFLDGDPTAKAAMVAGMLVIAVATSWLGWQLRTDAGYSQTRTIAVGHLSMLCSFTAIYYFGVFSPAPMILPFGLFFFSSSQSARATFVLYASCAGLYAIVGLLAATGIVADRGLFSGDVFAESHRVFAVVAAQGVLLATYVAARANRNAAVATIAQHDQDVRALAMREALLREARAELERALMAGHLGRFTDTRVGDFRLGRLLGRGGMGEVYEAEHAGTHARAAVKLLHAHALADPDLLRRFLREARIVSAIESPHVVRVLEIGGLEAPLPYIAMELLQGDDLADLLRREGRFGIRGVLTLVREVGRGLEAARRAGIVHRDLKPRNLFHAETGGGTRLWKILDFGVSKLLGAEGTQSQGALIGTPAYMAPEQASGGVVDHRSDLHALGVIAYRALTGRPAFTGEALPETLYQIVHTMPPRPSSLAHLSPAFDDVLLVAMAKDPAHRFDSGAELADALERASRGEETAEVDRRARRLASLHPWGRGGG